LATVNDPRFADLSPGQIVAILAEEGIYVGLAEFCLQDFRLANGESLGPHAQAVVTTVLLLEAD
jgi:hypothetical protein